MSDFLNHSTLHKLGTRENIIECVESDHFVLNHNAKSIDQHTVPHQQEPLPESYAANSAQAQSHCQSVHASKSEIEALKVSAAGFSSDSMTYNGNLDARQRTTEGVLEAHLAQNVSSSCQILCKSS